MQNAETSIAANIQTTFNTKSGLKLIWSFELQKLFVFVFFCGIGCFDKMRHVDRFSIDQVYMYNQLYIIATKVVLISIFAFLYLRKYCDIRGD